jgi:hypothetical protein
MNMARKRSLIGKIFEMRASRRSAAGLRRLEMGRNGTRPPRPPFVYPFNVPVNACPEHPSASVV